MSLLFAFLLISSISGGALGGLELKPNVTEAERYVNDTFIVTCHGQGARNTLWKGPSAKPITSNKGRVHVEERLADNENQMAVLVFERIERDDRGAYTCHSTVNGDKVQVTFKLAVVKAITMFAPEEQNVTEYQNSIVKCEVTGDPAPSVVWHFQGNAVSQSNDPNSRYKTMPMGLRIANITRADGGEYSCRAFQVTSRSSNIKAATIRLNVLHKPVWKNNNKSEKDLAYGYEGGLVNLTCEAEAQPPASFVWFRHNKTVTQQHNLTIVNELHRSVLQFELKEKRVLGDYECEATNNLGRIRKTINLQKGSKPKQPNRVYVVEVGAHSAQLDISTHTKQDVVLGYRVQFLRRSPPAEHDWRHPEYQDVYKNERTPPYTIMDLTPNTEYVLRVATRNAAGLSDFTGEYYIRTRDATSAGWLPSPSFVLLPLALFLST